MIKRILGTIAVLAMIVAVAAAITLIPPAQLPVGEPIEVPRTSRVTCLATGETLFAADEVAVDSVGSGEAGPSVARSDSLIVGGVLTPAPDRTYVPCAGAVTSGIVLVPDPANAELFLVNSDSNEAVVDLTLLGPQGEVPAAGARGIALAPGVTRPIALSVLAPTGPVGVAFTATQGRVALAATGVAGRAAQYALPTQTASEHVIGGIPSVLTAAQLVISNPHEERIDVAVEALGATSTYEPAPTAGLRVEPFSTVTVDLGSSLGGEASGLRVTAGQDFAAGVVVSGAAGPPNMLIAGEQGHELAAPGLGGELLLTNPGESTVTATVRVGAETVSVSVPAGTTVVQPVASGSAVEVSVEGDAALVGSVVSADEVSTVVVPLGRVGDEAGAAGSVGLDPHLR